ncbi:hypothetical protein ACSZOO_15355 [Aeromonas hydrophila]
MADQSNAVGKERHDHSHFRGPAGPVSRLLIHADEPGQANRLALLVSQYGHQPRILDARQLLSPDGQGDALLISSRQFGAEVRLGLSLWPGVPRLLFCERIGTEPQIALLQQGVLLVPHPCGEREPVEQWLRLAAASWPWCRRWRRPRANCVGSWWSGG